MKRSIAGLGAAFVGVCFLAACNGPHRTNPVQPSVSVKAAHHTMETGERIAVHATTTNLVASSAVKWTVSPTNGQIAATNDSQVAMFTANQPGTYLITATVDAGNGQMVQDSTNVVVNGMGMQ